MFSSLLNSGIALLAALLAGNPIKNKRLRRIIIYITAGFCAAMLVSAFITETRFFAKKPPQPAMYPASVSIALPEFKPQGSAESAGGIIVLKIIIISVEANQESIENVNY
ncbi:MAG: hypothetical protein LBH43_18165 [Treponema sp.]|jgi:hypothetical protein|nr:hypothetical protein [Treponema sp.]